MPPPWCGKKLGSNSPLRTPSGPSPAVWAARASSSPAAIAVTPTATDLGDGRKGLRISPMPASPNATGTTTAPAPTA